MKIYFAGSIRGGRDDQEIYTSIISQLQKYGSVFTEHIGDKGLTDQGEVKVTVESIFHRDVTWLKECDLVLAEVTTPSLGIGYEIAHAESLGKPIICLYRQIEGKSLSAMISGNPLLKVFIYKDINDLVGILDKYFSEHT